MNEVNYDKLMVEICQKEKNDNKKLLLHSCCAPCSTACLERLVEFFDVTVFYYNPNVTEEKEYFLRKEEQQNFLSIKYKGKVKFIEGDYISQEFYEQVKGKEHLKEGSSRCYDCYFLRLKKCCEVAKDLNFDYFCSTLSVSPYKNAKWLNEIGYKLQRDFGVNYLPNDFKKQNGYRRSVELSKEFNLYRQDYCGCEFSRRDKVENNCGKAQG